MWLGKASLMDMDEAGRWTVAFFSADTAAQTSVFPMLTLRDVVDEIKISLEPSAIKAESINYLGLENIRSLTGELVDFVAKHPSEVKSRSKTYEQNDVLYGRLRPELNKVYLAEGTVSPGICSNEFLVLRAKKDTILPRYLRYALASPFVASFAQKLRSGASLPRLSAADLLELKIPVPPLSMQNELVSMLERLDDQLRSLRAKLQWLPTAMSDAFTGSVTAGCNELTAVEQNLSESAQ